MSYRIVAIFFIGSVVFINKEILISSSNNVYAFSKELEIFQESCKEVKFEYNKFLKLIDCKFLTSNVGFTVSLTYLLSKNPNLNNLMIVDTDLEQGIPDIICKLTKLQNLHLINNNIQILPKNCFSQLPNIETVQISNNLIEKIEGGVFEGLKSLKELTLSNNRINFIDTHLFSNISNLPKLLRIFLTNNELTSIDPWPILRGTSLNFTYIDLRENKINKFTNNINWYYDCNMRTDDYGYYFDYLLTDNKIERLNDFFRSCFKKELDYICLSGSKFHSDVSIKIDSNNPFNCDCVDHVQWPRLTKFGKISFMNKARCNKPPNLFNQYWINVKPIQLECDVTNLSCIEGCTCIKQAKFYYHISCKSLKQLPSELPSRNVLTKYVPPYKLSFSGSPITQVDDKDYFVNVSWLDLSNDNIDTITPKALESILQIETVELHSNKLTSLPQYTGNITVKSLSLHNNMWDCSCGNVWFKHWLIKLKTQNILFEPDSIHCNTPNWLESRNIFMIADEEFCVNPHKAVMNKNLLIILLSIFGSIFGSILLFFIIYKIARCFKVQLHAYLNIHPLDKDECIGETMEFDAFISCAYFDRQLSLYLIRLLESKGYRICYHEKDFIGGVPIVENIKHAIHTSKRVICLLSNEFIKSHYCILEFQMALDRNIRIKKNRLIIVLDKCLELATCSLPEELNNFLHSHTYIINDFSLHFVNHLLYSMPVKKLGTSAITESANNKLLSPSC